MIFNEIDKINFNDYFYSPDNTILGKVNNFQKLKIFSNKIGINTFQRVLGSITSNHVAIEDRKVKNKKQMIMFGSNNYLGLASNPSVLKTATDIVKEYGVGSGGSPLLCGTNIFQEKLEKKLAGFLGFEDAIVFSSGYIANIGLITALARENDLIINDRLNHASIIDGCKLSGAKYVLFKHNCYKSLEEKILSSQKYKNRMILCIEGVYSMDGDVANLPEILKVAKKNNIIVILDEAHALGVLGEKGQGTMSYYNINKGVDIIIGTLSKSIGGVGGFVASNKKIIDYIRAFARSNVYSTSISPVICAASIEALNIIENTPELITKLWENIKYVKSGLSELGYKIPNTNSAIIPVFINDLKKLLLMSKEIHKKGIFVNAIFAPVVSAKSSRFRISVMASHTKDDINMLLNVFESVGKKYKVI